MRVPAALLGLAVAAAAAAEAGACSIRPTRPSQWAPAQYTLAQEMERRREPRLAPLIRNARYVEIAVAADLTEIGRTNLADAHPHIGHLEGLEVETYSVRFETVERLKGQGPDEFEIHEAGGLPIVTFYEDPYRAELAGWRAQAISSFDMQGLVEIEVVTSCGEAAGAFFQPSGTYLLVRNGDSSVEAAILLSPRALTREDLAAPEFQDHLWLRMVHQALADPASDRILAMSVREYLRARGIVRLYEVTDCARPYLAMTGWLDQPDRTIRAPEFDIQGYPASYEAFLESDMAARFRSGLLGPPLDYADYAVIDARRYDRTPVDPRFCEAGQRFLGSGGFGEFFSIDRFGLVDLTNFATQLHITDPGRYPLSQVIEWLQPETSK
ncbi:MAG: hypothetical protein KIS81_04295 [Maricaulaceae bacterium]|nr:hypothetical protein [Maricaulaceae bacterium]